MTYRKLSAALAFAFLTTTAVPVVSADTNTVMIHDFAFSPNSLTVSAGSVVTWKNLDGEPHTVVSAQGLFRSEALDENDSYSFKFDRPGTYAFICSIHPQMRGTIVVQ